jgi:hypothetical protein
MEMILLDYREKDRGDRERYRDIHMEMIHL